METVIYTGLSPEEQIYIAIKLAVLAVIFLALLCFNYAVALLITLLAIEDPSTPLPLLSTTSSETHPLLPRREKAYITDSIPGTLHHLKRIGGHTAPWRGLIGSGFQAFSTLILRRFLVPKLGCVIHWHPAARVIGGTLAVCLLSRLGITMLHIRITYPQRENFLIRNTYISGAATLATIPAVTINAFLKLATAEVPFLPCWGEHVKWVVTALCTVFLVIPSSLALARVRASLLGEDGREVVAVRRVPSGMGFWRALFTVPYARLMWFLVKGLPVWVLVHVVAMCCALLCEYLLAWFF